MLITIRFYLCIYNMNKYASICTLLLLLLHCNCLSLKIHDAGNGARVAEHDEREHGTNDGDQVISDSHAGNLIIGGVSY